MRVLAIETSCDETAIAVLECTGGTDGASFTVLSNELHSQAALHAEYGGVFPTLAKREHQKNLPILYERVIAEAGADVDLIAVTQGPGLEPALWQGILFAKELAEKTGVPIIGMDHMEGHIVSGLVTKTGTMNYELGTTAFPILGLLISGGHTELVVMKSWFEYELVGKTKDDAIGEAFDKVARLLGLPYPGGPLVDQYAARARARGASADTHGIVFPRPLIHEHSCNFSFSGLKTAVLYKLKDMGDLTEETKEHIADAFQTAARDVVIHKTARALDETGARMLVVGGGVSANEEIRAGLRTLITDTYTDVSLSLPDKTLTGDNALMIGMAAYLRHSAGKAGGPLEARGSQSLAQVV
jgi:N6-L-threonylcarbamoyladenine synthase